LVGRQGLFKTTFFEALAGKENFASVSGDVNDRKFLMTMRKYWISELGEIDAAFRSNDWGRLKDFLSKSVDSYVPPYGTKAMEFPRIGVLAGSTNYEKPLRDVGGEFRRYWCVRIEKPIDIAWVKEHRDEIWAAATHLYHAGFQWWLNEEEVAAHAIHAQQFAAESSLYEKLLEILPTTRTFKVGDGKVTVKWTEDIFAISSLISEMGVTGRASEMTIASDLKRLGFEKKQARGYLGKTQYWYLKDPATFNGVASTVDVMPNEIRLMLKPAE
jgi:predicted P-loop ATPase